MLQERKPIFKQMKVQDKNRKKWQEVLKMEYMFSEDSDGNENELKICQLPWLSNKVQKFKELLDSEKQKNMNAQSKRQRKSSSGKITAAKIIIWESMDLKSHEETS